MKRLLSPIACNGIELANTILIPQSILEKFVGLRGRVLKNGEAMLWYFKKPEIQLFDTFGCPADIGYLALDEDKKVLQKGIMQPQKVKFIKCNYWIEVLPEVINKVNIGDEIKGLNHR